MVYEMKLQPLYYDFIAHGTKRIEIRLFDEKRQKLNLGDTIRFFKLPDLKETMEVEITGLLRYSNFDELLEDFDISLLADSSVTKEELIDILNTFYSREEQKKYGILGIKFKKTS